MNYYKILKIHKTASKIEIKKAYHKLSRIYHPDKSGGNGALFKEINEAYEVLRDDNKKEYYDRYGSIEGYNDISDIGGIHENMFDIINNFVMKTNKEKKCPDLLIKINLDLEDIYKGAKIGKIVNVEIPCDCNNNFNNYCPQCKGFGFIEQIFQPFPGMIHQAKQTCNICNGRGNINKCKICFGAGYLIEEKQIEFSIKKGVNKNDKIIVSGEGHQKNGYLNGDIIFIVDEIPHKKFKRIHNKHLFTKHKIKLVDSLLYNPFIIEHLDGRKIYVKSDKIIKPGEIKKIIGEGFEGGDLLIKFEIEFPDYIEKEDLLEDVLGQKRNIIKETNHYKYLVEYDSEYDKNINNDKNKDEVNCATQ